MLDFVEGYYSLITTSPSLSGRAMLSHDPTSVYLTVTSAFVDIMISDQAADRLSSVSSDLQMHAQIAIQALTTLSLFSSAIYSSGPLEGYERVLYGLLDILVALAGTDGVSRLFQGRSKAEEKRSAVALQAISAGSDSDEHDTGESGARDAWWLSVAEIVCREMSAETIQEMREVINKSVTRSFR